MKPTGGALVLLATMAAMHLGCREPDRSGRSSSEPPPPAETLVPAELSPAQAEALDLVAAAGGEIQRDAVGGLPLRIDLASERVFARDEVVRAVLQFPSLKRLRLAVSSVSKEVLAGLANLTELEELMLQDAPLGDADLVELLAGMPRLERLTLRRLHQVSDATLEALAAGDRLEVLALIEMPRVTGTGLQRLAMMPRLRSLDLRQCGNLATGDFRRLAALEGLAELKLGGPAIGDAMAEVVAGLPVLRSLTIEDAEISAAFLQGLAKNGPAAARLHSLALARCYGVTDEALEAIVAFPNLETLALHEIPITGTFLESLRGETGPLPLKTLIATNAFLSDGTICHLPAVMPHLVRLDLRGNPGITDQSLPVFEGLADLKDLNLEDTGAATAGQASRYGGLRPSNPATGRAVPDEPQDVFGNDIPPLGSEEP